MDAVGEGFAPPLTPEGVERWLRRRRVGFARY
jgi:hypothetical protein